MEVKQVPGGQSLLDTSVYLKFSWTANLKIFADQTRISLTPSSCCEPFTLQLVKVLTKSTANDDVMSEWRSSQVQTEPLHCCWRVLVRQNKIKWVNGLVNPPSGRPAGSFPCSRQMEVLTARLCAFHCWVATAIWAAEPLPASPITRQPTPKINTYWT